MIMLFRESYYAAIAAQVGLSQTGVFDICKRFATKGKKGLVSGKRGRKPGEQRRLTSAQETEVKRLICRLPATLTRLCGFDPGKSEFGLSSIR
jgi:hypothetical protein